MPRLSIFSWCIASAALGGAIVCVPNAALQASPVTGVLGPASPKFVLSAADSGWVGDSIPPFQTEPLITWGPLPPGTVHEAPPLAFDVQHQSVSVRFDWEHHTVLGSTTIRFAVLDTPLRAITLDAVDMKIVQVTTSQGGKTAYDYDGKHLVIQMPRVMPAHAKASVTVVYEAADRKKGAYFIDRVHYLWTQGETEENRYWIPIHDRPDDKLTWAITVVTDTGERALSNGRLTGSRKIPGGVQWTWAQEKPASSYLMSVVTGKYVVIKDRWKTVPVNYWTYPDSVEAGRRGFAQTPRAMEIFSQKTGVPFPWAKYDQSVVPDFIFGGMENVSATTQNDNSILHPAWADQQTNADGLMAHELGHQWYGDLLTTQSWPHVWLNEGFATFMEQIYQEEVHGVDAGALDRLGEEEQTIAADRRARRPIVYDRWVKDPIEVFFSGHIYPKGATVLQMLRHRFGDSLFWAAMHHYTTKHAYKNVVTSDLQVAFEEATGQDLKTFFNQWVYGAGFPVFQVSYNFDTTSKALTLRAREVHARDSLTGYFDADVDVEVLTDTGPVRGVVQVRDGVGEVTLPVGEDPRSIRWNKGKWLLELTDFPRPLRMILYQLTHDDDILGRVEAIGVLRSYLSDRTAIAALEQAATSDTSWAIRVRALHALADARVARDEVVASVLRACDDRDARVRQAAAQALGKLPPSSAAMEVLTDFAEHDGSFFVRGVALASYLQLAGDEGLALTERVLEQPSWRNTLQKPVLAVLKEMPGAAAQALYAKYTDKSTHP